MDRFTAAYNQAHAYALEHKRETAIAAGVTGVALAAVYAWRRAARYVPSSGPYPISSRPADAYDAIIVGAGPAGATCGYFLAKAGIKAALLEKETFPRDKYCADAVCTPGIQILAEMNVLQELIDNKETHFADSGGLVSPNGTSFIGASKQKLGKAAAVAVKRIILDMRVAKNAQRAGADLKESFEVTEATFDKAVGLWTVTSATGASVKGRVLVIADGATSKLATKLGYCTEAAKGVSSRAYVEGGTHNTDFDGVCFYPKWSLPGYACIFKHTNDELLFCYYLLPCGKPGYCGDVTVADLARLHHDAITRDPFISAALGPNAKMERMRVGSLRMDSQGIRTSYDDHLLIVGDAAGHIDPLTGEGIHTGMLGGKAAAQTIADMVATGDFSRASTAAYQRRWYKAFGHDFYLSTRMAEIVYRYPIILDAVASEMQRQGDAMMAKWAEVMTCMQPKTYFLQPHVAIPLAFSILREIWAQKVMGKKDRYQLPPAAAAK